MAIQTHDEHYRFLPVEPIDLIRAVIESDAKIDPMAKYCIGQSLKYILRAGQKPNEPWERDIEKAMNYLNYALTENWISGGQK